jgi:hypothetical protein
MTEIDPFVAHSAVQERTVTVPQCHNTLSISLRDHSWVSISDGDEEIAGNYTPVPIFRLSVSPGTYTVRSDGVIEQVSSEFMQPMFSPFEQLPQGLPAQLYLTSDAPDQHIVDGVGEILADGTSFCTITVEAVTLDGTPLTGQAQEGEVFLRWSETSSFESRDTN